MTPRQIALVEGTVAAVDLDALATDFYRRAVEGDPNVATMFTTDPEVQRARFAAELEEIVRSIVSMNTFLPRVRALGARHRDYGVTAHHYRHMGVALLGALAAATGEGWTEEVEEAWALAYNLVAETMLLGAMAPLTD